MNTRAKPTVRKKKVKAPSLAELDRTLDSIVQHMATKEDLDDLHTELKGDIAALDAKFTHKYSEVVASVDKFITTTSKLEIEQAALSHNLQRQESWAKQFSERLGITLEY